MRAAGLVIALYVVFGVALIHGNDDGGGMMKSMFKEALKGKSTMNRVVRKIIHDNIDGGMVRKFFQEYLSTPELREKFKGALRKLNDSGKETPKVIKNFLESLKTKS